MLGHALISFFRFLLHVVHFSAEFTVVLVLPQYHGSWMGKVEEFHKMGHFPEPLLQSVVSNFLYFIDYIRFFGKL